MIINFALWSPLISLLAISFLYPLRLHYRGHEVSQIYAAILAFPAVVSSLYLCYFSALLGSISGRIFYIPYTSLFFTIQISWQTSLILIAIFSSIFLTIFINKKENFTENISVLSLAFIVLFTISSIPDQLIRLSVLSVGTMVSSFMILRDNHEQTFKLSLADFLLQRVSDFLALFALLLPLAYSKLSPLSFTDIVHQELHDIPILLFNSSIIIRIISLIIYKPLSNQFSPRCALLRKIIIGIGSLLLISSFTALLPRAEHLRATFLITALVLLFVALGAIVIYRNRTKLIEDMANALIVGALVAIYSGFDAIALALLAIVIVAYPIIILQTSLETLVPISTAPSHKKSRFTMALANSKSTVIQFIVKMITIISKLFTNLISPLYSGFIFYYLPQISITVLELPLRPFHNGNIQRSLIFAALMLVGYIYWWGE